MGHARLLIALSVLFSLLITINKEAHSYQLLNAPPATANKSLDSQRIGIYNQKAIDFLKTNLDSAAYYANNALDLSRKTKNLSAVYQSTDTYCKVLDKQGNIALAIETCLSLIAYTQQSDDPLLTWKATKLVTLYFHKDRQYDKMAEYITRQYKLERALSFGADTVVNTASRLVLTCLRSADYEKAAEVVMETRKFIDSNAVSLPVESLFFKSVRNFYYTIQEYDKAAEYAEIALQLHIRLGKTTELIESHLFYGDIQAKRGQIDEGKRYYREGLRLSHEHNNTKHLYMINAKFGYLYMKEENYDSAIYQFSQALKAGQLKSDTAQIVKAYCSMGGAYLKTGNLGKGKEALIKFKQFYENNVEALSPHKVYALEVYLNLSKIDSALQNYKESLAHYKVYTRLQKEIADENNRLKIEELELQYETAKMNEEIAFLNSQNEIQTLKTGQRERLIWWILGVTVLLVVLLFVLYNRYRLKQRSMKVIEQKSKENEMLVQEVHHRVKNNLQIMMSLLSTQSRLIHDERAKAVIVESSNRIMSMALIHRSLYESGNLVMVSARTYIEELVNSVAKSFKDSERNVSISTDVVDQEIRMKLALPIGLILNELITNSFKYAFKGKLYGEIRVKFVKCDDHDKYHLRIEDNGIGLPDDFQFRNANSFGLKLVQGLTEQLNGRIKISEEAGTRFDIYLNNQDVERTDIEQGESITAQSA
ncbi:MAG: sensor histidine kinase [Bacteroidota bacterium]